MENLHIRSNSLPSGSHPVVSDVQEHFHRLRSSEEASTSVSEDLASLRDLHEGVNSLLQLPSVQQALTDDGSKRWTDMLLEESLRVVDLCGFSREILALTKGSIQELQSSLRRNRDETSAADVVNAYTESRKKIGKMIAKFIKNFNHSSMQFLGEDSDIKTTLETLKETAGFDISVLKSVLMFLSGEEGRTKRRSWPLISKLTQTSRAKRMDAVDVQNFLAQQKSSEVAIQELEVELEAYYRALINTRVSLLNALSH